MDDIELKDGSCASSGKTMKNVARANEREYNYIHVYVSGFDGHVVFISLLW